MIGRILLSVAAIALAGFVGPVLIGLWDRHAQEGRAAGFSGIYERYLAAQAGFPNDPRAYEQTSTRAACRAGRRSSRNGGARGMISANYWPIPFSVSLPKALDRTCARRILLKRNVSSRTSL